MGFSTKPSNQIKFFKIQGLKKDIPMHYFEVDGERINDTNFEGTLIKISPSEYEYEGIPRQTIKFLFMDNTNTYYQLDISYNMLSRGLINSILGYIDTQKRRGHTKGVLNIELSLYMSKDNYKKMGIRINGEKPEWRYSIEEQKKMIETIIRKNGVKENDYFEYDEVLKKSLPEIQDYIEGSEEVVLEKNNYSNNEEEEISIEDIPF